MRCYLRLITAIALQASAIRLCNPHIDVPRVAASVSLLLLPSNLSHDKRTKRRMLEEPRVVIVGAGAAGISAACRLIEEGLRNVTILEAKHRIGGRLHTVEFCDNVVDLGGQWVHGETQNIVYNLANHHNLLESSHHLNNFEKHSFVDAKGKPVPLELTTRVWRLFYEIADKASEELKDADGSYGEYFTKEFYKYFKNNPFTDDARAEQFLEWMHKFDNSLQCSDSWFDVSARGSTEYATCDGDLLLNWKDRGYKTVFDLLMRAYPNPQKALPVMDKVVFGKEVTSIDSSGKEVVVKTSDGERYTATQVVFTASLGVLKEQHSTLFVPPLPEKKQLSIKGLNIGAVAKIFLEFPHRWWPEDSAGFGLLWSKEDKREFLAANGEEKRWLTELFQFFTVDFQPRLLCGWLVGEPARHMEGLSEAEVKDGVYELLEKFMGRRYNVPRPDRILRSKWHSDPHFRGCYSYRSMATERLNVWASDLAQPIVDASGKPTILFAGEATHDHYYSTVHGAVETGYREADRILRYYRQVAKSFGKAEIVERMRGTEPIVERTRLVIVGAGIAGLAAAKTLEDEHFEDYILLEAQDRVGGRICSIPWNDGWIEAGAQFLHGDRSTLGELARQHNFLSEAEATEGEGIFVRNDGSRVDQRLVNEVDDLVRDVLEDCEKYACSDAEPNCLESIGKLLRCEMFKYHRLKNDSSATRRQAQEIFDWNVKFLMIDNSCFTLDELSTKNWGQFRFVGGPEHLVFKKGYSSLTQHITEKINRKKLRLNSPVETIEWRRIENNDEENAKPIVVTLSDKKQILADCIIVTSSLGYLKENHRKMFIPELPPNLVLGIDCLGFGLINKIFLDFGESWWEPGTKGFQMLWSKKSDREITFENSDNLASWIRDLTGFDVLENHEGILLGWVGGRGAYIVEKLSEDEVASDCIDALRSFLQRDNLPAPKRCKRTRWNANKYVRGAYSHIPTSCDEPGISPAVLAEPVWGTIVNDTEQKNVPVLMLAGEATHKHFYSTTHGAYDTGKTQALNFLRHHVAE